MPSSCGADGLRGGMSREDGARARVQRCVQVGEWEGKGIAYAKGTCIHIPCLPEQSPPIPLVKNLGNFFHRRSRISALTYARGRDGSRSGTFHGERG